MVCFTGSTRAGKAVAAAAAGTLKRVALELGGKSANVLLDDLDDAGFEKAVRDGVGKAYLNSGQTCTALTRMLVPTGRMADAERIAADEVETKFQPKRPVRRRHHARPAVERSPGPAGHGLHPEGHRRGRQAGHRWPEQPEGLGDGYFVKPTVFSEVRNDMTIAQEEIFGPVLSIIAYEDEDDAARIANDSVYGLAGGVWSADRERAKAFARRIRTGQIEVNGGAFNPNAPFGGFKNSGYGREYGQHGFEEFLEVKSMTAPSTPAVPSFLPHYSGRHGPHRPPHDGGSCRICPRTRRRRQRGTIRSAAPAGVRPDLPACLAWCEGEAGVGLGMDMVLDRYNRSHRR